MITKTIGVGGNYAKLSLAWDYLISLGAWSDDVTLNIISAFTEDNWISTAPTAAQSIALNTHSLTINGSWHLITESGAKGGIFIKTKNGTASGGHLYINDVDIYVSTNTVGTGLYISMDNTDTYLEIDISKLQIRGPDKTTVTGLFLDIGYQYATARTHLRVSNLQVSSCKIGIETTCSSGSGTLVLDRRICENSTIYNCATGISKPGGYDNAWTFKNVVSSGCTSKDWESPAAGYTTQYLYNCADSDNSIALGVFTRSNCVTGVTVADYLSVDPASSKYLKIPTTGKLYGFGLTTGLLAANTFSIEGYPRPNVFGAVSIGAHEPNVAIDFTATPLDPAIYDPVSFVPIINEATIPIYWWDLDDGKVSGNSNPIDSYSAPGFKTISMTVYDREGRIAVVTKPDYINVRPYLINFTAVPTSGACPLKVRFESTFARKP